MAASARESILAYLAPQTAIGTGAPMTPAVSSVRRRQEASQNARFRSHVTGI
jgi:hypothetical protein